MRTVVTACALITACFIGSAPAGELRTIELTDGGTLTGEVLSLSNGMYTIKTPSLGEMRIEESKIRSIRSGSAPAPAAGTGASPADTTALQEKLLRDKEVVALIQSLQNDPDFQKVLQDPDLMKAVQAGDLAVLQSHPEFMKLLNNATVGEIRKKVQ